MRKNAKTRAPLVIWDAWFTLFQSRENRRAMISRFYREIGRLPDDMSDEQIESIVSKLRRRFAAIEKDEDYWFLVNVAFFNENSPDPQHATPRAKKVRSSVMESPSQFYVQRAMINLLRLLKGRYGARLVIGSNANDQHVKRYLRHFGLLGGSPLFDAIYTSEMLGTRKPYPAFWQSILEQERTDDPKHVVHVGNSPNSDIGAAKLGIPVVIYDRERRLKTGFENIPNVLVPDHESDKLRDLAVQSPIVIVHSVNDLRKWLKSHLERKKHS